MSKKLNSIYAMQRRVYHFFTKNKAFLMTLPLFETLYNSFESGLNQIAVLNEEYEKDISGITRNKENIKKQAFKMAMELQRRLIAFAKLNNNEVLIKEVSYTESDLSRCSDSTFLSSCQVIYKAGANNESSASGYGINPDLLTHVKIAIDDFSTVIDAPREGQIGKTQIYDLRESLLRENQNILSKTDLLIDTVKNTHPQIYKEYYDTRKVIIRSGSLMVKAQVEDAITGAAVIGAVVSFRLDGVLMLEKTSADGGGFNVKTMEEGIYEVTTTKMGYPPDVREIVIIGNELNAINIALKKF